MIWPKEVNLVSRTQPLGPLCLWQCFIGYFPNKLFSRARVFQCTPIKVLKVPIKVFWFVSFLTTIHLCQMYPVSSCLVHIGPKGQDLLLSWPFQIYKGHSCKIGNMCCPGTLKNQIPNLKKRNKFFCFFMFLYPIQGGKNIGSPYLTNKSWFFGKSDVPGQQNKSYIGVMASKNLIFLMFWLSFVYL